MLDQFFQREPMFSNTGIIFAHNTSQAIVTLRSNDCFIGALLCNSLWKKPCSNIFLYCFFCLKNAKISIQIVPPKPTYQKTAFQNFKIGAYEVLYSLTL